MFARSWMAVGLLVSSGSQGRRRQRRYSGSRATPNLIARALRFGVLLAVVCPVLGSSATSATPNYEADLVARLNALRASRGLSQLVVDERITAIARNWAARMAGNTSTPHNLNLGNELPPGWREMAENVAYNIDPASIHRWWENSPSHFNNMLLSEITHVGVGVVQLNGYLWAVQDFAGYPVATVAPTQQPSPAPPQPVQAPRRTYSRPALATPVPTRLPSPSAVTTARPLEATPSPPANWPTIVDVTPPNVTWANAGIVTPSTDASSSRSSRAVGTREASSSRSDIARTAVVVSVAIALLGGLVGRRKLGPAGSPHAAA